MRKMYITNEEFLPCHRFQSRMNLYLEVRWLFCAWMRMVSLLDYTVEKEEERGGGGRILTLL